VWIDTLDKGELRQAMVEESRLPGEAFYKAMNEEFIPALRNKEVERAQELLATRLPEEFGKHRAAINKVVEQTTEKAAANEAEAASIISSRTWWQVACSVLLLAITGGLTYVRCRQTGKQERQISENAARNDAISRSQAVIEFNMEGLMAGRTRTSCRRWATRWTRSKAGTTACSWTKRIATAANTRSFGRS
jgi:hypothetical protein